MSAEGNARNCDWAAVSDRLFYFLARLIIMIEHTLMIIISLFEWSKARY